MHAGGGEDESQEDTRFECVLGIEHGTYPPTDRRSSSSQYSDIRISDTQRSGNRHVRMQVAVRRMYGDPLDSRRNRKLDDHLARVEHATRLTASTVWWTLQHRGQFLPTGLPDRDPFFSEMDTQMERIFYGDGFPIRYMGIENQIDTVLDTRPLRISQHGGYSERYHSTEQHHPTEPNRYHPYACSRRLSRSTGGGGPSTGYGDSTADFPTEMGLSRTQSGPFISYESYIEFPRDLLLKDELERIRRYADHYCHHIERRNEGRSRQKRPPLACSDCDPIYAHKTEEQRQALVFWRLTMDELSQEWYHTGSGSGADL